jgi:oligoribonuclease
VSNVDDYFAFLDIETTGLRPEKGHVILEVGIAIATRDFEIVDYLGFVVEHFGYNLSRISISSFVGEMHTANGLWEEVQSDRALPAYKAEGYLLDFMKKRFRDDKPPMAGASLAMDRTFLRAYMPQLDEAFHYRSIDNSSTKELCRRLNPVLYSTLPKFDTDHRVKTCLEGTVAEAKFYADNFLFQEW